MLVNLFSYHKRSLPGRAENAGGWSAGAVRDNGVDKEKNDGLLNEVAGGGEGGEIEITGKRGVVW